MMIHPVAVVVPRDNRDNLTQMMNDVQELALHAKRLLAELEVSMDGTSARLTDATTKAEALRKGKLKTALDNLHGTDAAEYVRSVQEKKFKPTKTLATSIPDIFKEESRPVEAIALRNACWDSPDFSIFEKLNPGCSLKFSNPGFFYQEWSRVQMKENDEAERKMNEEKEAKKRNKERKKKELESSILSTGSDAKSIPGNQPSRRVPRPPTQSNIIPISMQPQQVGPGESQVKRPPRPHSMAQPQSTTPPEVANDLASKRVSRPPTATVPSGAPARPTRNDAPNRPARIGMMAVGSNSASNVFDQPPPAPQRVPSASPTSTTTQPPPPPVPRPVRPSTPQDAATTSHVEAYRTAPRPLPVARPAPAPPATGALSPRSDSSASSYETAAATVPSPPSTTISAPPPQPPLVETTIRATRQRPPPPAPPPPPPAAAVVTTPMQSNTTGTQSPMKSVDAALVRTKRAQAPAPPPPMETSAMTSFQPAADEDNYALPAKRAPPPVVPSIQTSFEEEEDPTRMEVTPPGAEVQQQYQQQEVTLEEEEPQTQTEEVRNPMLDDPVLKKFAMMQKMNLPQGAIEQAMIRAKVDPARLFGDAAMNQLSAPPVKIVIPPRLEVESARPEKTAAGGSIMEELLQGKVLRKVESSSSSPRASGAPSSVSSELMQGILEGRNKLKKVEAAPPEAKKPVASNLDSGGVASILARRIAIVGDKGSDTDSAGSEWDDSDDD